MGRRGPAPKPTELKKLQGTDRADRRARNQPRPKVEVPSCPSWLSREAKREWRRIVKELEILRLVSQLDRATLAAYCEAYGEWYEANRTVKTEGRFQTIITKNGSEYVQVHPAVSVKNAAIERMKKFAVEFGLTPAARSRIEAAESDDDGESNAFLEIL